MKYTYKQSLYYYEAICCLVLSVLVGVTLTYTYDRTIGFGVAITGCVISGLFHAFGQSCNRFVFVVQADGLVINYHRNSAKIAWSDIEKIREDERGLHIKCHSWNAELPILNYLENYESFKKSLMSMGKARSGGDER